MDENVLGNFVFELKNFFLAENEIVSRVYDGKIALENLFVRNVNVFGTVRVVNCSYEKYVFVRYTFDGWKTFEERMAYFSMHYDQTNTTSFQFQLILPRSRINDDPLTLTFVLGFFTGYECFWDNNFSQNYSLNVVREKNLPELNRETFDQLVYQYKASKHSFESIGVPCGLRNVSGSCYMNSLLQTLFFTPPLVECLFKNFHQSKPTDLVTNEFFNLMQLLASKQFSSLDPSIFKQIFGHFQCEFLTNEQHDVHEFLLYLFKAFKESSVASTSLTPLFQVDHTHSFKSTLDIVFFCYRAPINFQQRAILVCLHPMLLNKILLFHCRFHSKLLVLCKNVLIHGFSKNLALIGDVKMTFHRHFYWNFLIFFRSRRSLR